MYVSLVCLATVALSFTTLSDGAPLHVLSAPSLLRVGSRESVFVESQDYRGGPLAVKVTVKSHPDRKDLLASKDVVLNADNHFQYLVDIIIAEAVYADVDPKQNHYVYLEAQFPDRVLEKVVLLSFQSGYIFIQTDKTLYTPASTVRFRIFALTTKMEPVVKDRDRQLPGQPQKDSAVSVEIMTPDNITVSMEIKNPEDGVIVGNYDILERVSLGDWKVVCRFQNTPQQVFTSVFEVKEYVLPSFEIKLIPEKAFFYVDDEQITVAITATYLFGKNVNGHAFGVFGVMTKENQKISIPESLQRVQIIDGKGSVQLTRAQMLKQNKMDALVGGGIFVSVNLLTLYGGEMVEAKKTGIQIVKSPYTITFQKTAKYFKPGMPFDLSIFITNPDGSPARGVPVTVSTVLPGNVPGITGANGVAKTTVNSVVGDNELSITVKTRDPGLSDARQASETMKALKYKTKTSNLLHISIDSKELEIGQNMQINLTPAGPVTHHDITLLVMSRGQLVEKQRFSRKGQSLITIPMPISKAMLPSFRLVAYYHVGTNEVVADSLWVEVKVSCMGTLKVETVRNSPSYRPAKQFTLKVTGDPGAKVGMVAVDKGVYVLNNQHRLTQTKIWEIVEKYDTGCTAGGGADSMGVFSDAGLVFETNTASGTGLRTDLKCPGPAKARRRRSLVLRQAKDRLESPFRGLERECCVDGMKDNTQNFTCERRGEYITDGPACLKAFLHCCKALEHKKVELKHPALVLARSDDDDGFMDARDITARSNFPETWLWEDYTLPECPANNKHCGTTNTEQVRVLPDSITTWEITAISLSASTGICVADAFEMIVLKDFFIDLKLPYSAVRNEQLEIKAVLHNYQLDPLNVRVELMENLDICSSASKKGKYRQTVKLEPMTSQVVPFIIIPQELGLHTIVVKASDNEYGYRDGVERSMKVVSQGILTKIITNIEVDPSKHGGEQKTSLPSTIPADIVPGTKPESDIQVTAGEQTSVLVEQAISGNSMGSLIVKPVGCGEQNMIYMTLPTIATHYLDKTNQWGTVGLDKRATAIKFINMGYTQELTYRKTDNSFSVWTHTPSSTWLTAYVTKVFALASNLVAVQKSVLCGAAKWLILNAQQPDGIFKDLGPVYHAEMLGNVRGKDTDASMTAFVLIALQEATPMCQQEVLSMPGSKERAVNYLLQRLPSLINPYAVAMTSYALANEGRLDKAALLKFRSPDMTHWPVPGGYQYTLEASAYALLALVQVEAFEEAGRIVKWLNLQKKSGGGYGSTQSTITVFQAVAEYWTKVKKVDQINLNIDLDVPGRAATLKYNINNANSFLSRTSNTKNFDSPLVLKATGKGEATLTVVTLYYAKPQEDKSDCKMFDVQVELQKQGLPSFEGAMETYLLKIDVLYRSDRDATMSILDIGMLTGFTADTDDLTRLSQGHERYIEKFEQDNALSERGSLIIYLNKVSFKRPDRVAFRIHKVQDVSVLQPASVSVYEYNDEKKCMKFYHPQRPGGNLNRLCQQDDICTCASESCTMQKKKGINDNTRIEKACESSAESKIDYVYKARLESLEQTHHTDKYSMRIEEVIKEGTDKLVQGGSLRTFVGFSFCREALGMEEGKSYLLMGHNKDLHQVDDDGSYQFELGENIWIEYWPSEAECKTAPEHLDTCLGLSELVNQIVTFGCRG